MADTYTHKGFSVALGLFVLLLSIYALLQSPLFELRTVEISGGERVTAADILSATGLSLGTNLFSIDLRQVAAVLQREPIVKDVVLQRRFPGTLVVNLKERTPIVYLTAENYLWVIDREGIALFRTQELSLSLPLVTLDPSVDVNAGERLNAPSLQAALGFVSSLSLKTLAEISEVHGSTEGLTAYTRSGIAVDLGSGGDMAEKARVLEALLDKMSGGRMNVSRIDLSRPSRPVVQEKR